MTLANSRGFVLAVTLVLAVAGCGDDDNGAPPTPTASVPTATQPSPTNTEAAPTATNTPAPPTATETVPSPTQEPPTPTPTEPLFGGAPECSGDTCQHDHTTLVAIAHSNQDPTGTILYRVIVQSRDGQELSTGTNWGDGVNGFFYQASVAGGATTTYIPFNGVGVDSNNRPTLRRFSFIVPASTSAGTITIKACATNYQGGATTTCTQTLWTDTYNGLPEPDTGGPPWGNGPSLEFESSDPVAVVKNGVYGGMMSLHVADTNTTQDIDLTTPGYAEWLAKHLVFFDPNVNAYTNDLFGEEFAALPIDEAAYPVSPGSTMYRTKYGATTSVKNDPSQPTYFFYTMTARTDPFGVEVKFLYDIPGSGGNLGGAAGLGAGATLGDCMDTPCKMVAPEPAASSFSVINEGQVVAGEQETRTICLTSGNQCYASPQGTCSAATNPVAVNTAEAFNLPDYVIDQALPNTKWGKTFPPALYYVVPSGFGNCDQGSTPFCERQSGFFSYVPHYLDLNGQTGSVGGGTAEPFVGGFSLADEYVLDPLSTSNQNRLIWFDNCGSGHVYFECVSGTTGCTGETLGSRITLPSPPSGFTKSTYTITNKLPSAVVFSKECCASWYRSNTTQQVTVLEPQQQIDNGYGVLIPPGESFTYETNFSDEAIVVYDAVTANRLYKLRLNPTDGQLYDCPGSCAFSRNAEGCPSASITAESAANTYAVDLNEGGVGTVLCEPIGSCPFGMTTGSDGDYTTCTTTDSNFIFATKEWVDENPFATNFVQVRAWGAAGGNSAGGGGFAMTVLQPSDLARDLFAYVGNVGGGQAGGSGSLLIPHALSSISIDLGNVTNPSLSGVEALVIAGGGGAGGASGDGASGGSGGAGGQAISNSPNIGSNSSVSSAGNDGNSNGCDGTQGFGRGGNKNGLGQGGSGGDTGGGGGVGGTGGNNNRWNYGSLVNSGSSHGNGGGIFRTNGAGGGGFGGGGSGTSCGFGGGGGGGGSWAAANTVFDPTGPPSSVNVPTRPNGSAGAIQFAYIPSGRAILYRLNGGGGKLDATDGGPPWIPDTQYLTTTGTDIATSPQAIDLKHHKLIPFCPFGTQCGVLGAGAPQGVFLVERYDLVGGSEMQYAFPVTNGDTVMVSLLLAETCPTLTTPGQRVFNVKVEGSVPSVFSRIDQVGESGAQYRAFRLSTVLTMTDDTLNLEFDHVTNNPSIKGIEIRTLESNVAARGLVTSSSHPVPIDCLTLNDTGVILANKSNYALVWQADGDLVLDNPQGLAIWRSGTSGKGQTLCFQSDGNLVIYGSAVEFATNTADAEHGNNGGVRMTLDNGCNLSIVDAGNNVLYQTTTTCSSTPLPTYTPTATATRTPTVTRTPTMTGTPTRTPTASRTPTPTRTITSTRTVTPTRTETPTPSFTATPSLTPTVTLTATSTPSPTPPPTSTETPIPTPTDTPTQTETPTPTPTATPTPHTVEVLVNELTSTNHPDPAACLQLPGDDGVVLDNGVAQLIWRSDGDLVLMQGSTILWESNTSDSELGGNGGRQLCFPNSLTVQNGSGTMIFSTQTLEGKILRLDAGCNLAVVSVSGSVLFQTNTACN